MGFKISSAIAIARVILNDTTPDYRYSDPDLLEYGNGCLRALPEIKPEWLTAVIDVPCTADKALQSLPTTAHGLVSINRIKNGLVVWPADRAALDYFSPGWMSATSAAAQNWMPDASSPRRFWIYPPAITSQVLEATVILIPGPYTADQDTGLPITITEAVADYIIGIAESRDDEHVNTNRATQFLTQFAARIGVKPQPQQQG